MLTVQLFLHPQEKDISSTQSCSRDLQNVNQVLTVDASSAQ